MKRTLRGWASWLGLPIWIGFSGAVQAVDFSTVPGTVLDYQALSYITFISSAPQKFISDPEIKVLADGTYIASHALGGWNSGDSSSGNTTVFRSTDKGASWTTLGTYGGILRASLFEQGGALYLLGAHDTDDGKPTTIMKSVNNGTSWTTSSYANLGGPATPNNPVVWGDRLWIATGTSNLSAPVASNLMVEASWKSTGGFPAYQPGWASDGAFIGEGQIVASPDLGVFIMPKVKDHALTALARVNASGGVSFDPANNFVDLPGGEKKFGAAYDAVSGKFYVLGNPLLPTDPAYLPSTTSADPDMIRNTAAILTSKDLLHWTAEKIFLYSGDIDHEGFGYLNFDFDGSNMVAAARTAWVIPGEPSPNNGRGGHDSNCFTIHKITDFRNASPDQYLKISGNNVLRHERTPDTKDDDVPLGPFTLGSSFAGAPLSSPNGIGVTAAGDVYVRETGGRILRFDPLGNFIETTNSSPVGFNPSQVNAKQPSAGECSWVKVGAGNWSDLANWYYWNRPDTAEKTAVFGSAISSATTVSIPVGTQTWNFNTADDQEGWKVSNASNTVVSAGYLQGNANNTVNTVQIYRTDPFFYGSTVPEVRIRLKADVNCNVNFYWGTTLADSFAAARRLTLAYTGNGAFQELVFPLAGNADWDGQAITRLRFDPLVHNTGGAREFSVDYIKVPKESCRIKGLRFRSPNAYTLSGTDAIRLEAYSGSGSVEVLQGGHVVDAGLLLGSDADAHLSGGTSLYLKKGIDLNGQTLNLSGSGQLRVQGALVMDGGTITVDGGAPLVFTNNTTGAVLDGSLEFLPSGAFAPSGGESYDLLDNQGLLGSKRFASVVLPALPVGLQWNTNSLYTTGNVAVEAVQQSLDVSTPHGTSNPSAGSHNYDYGTNLVATLSGSPVVAGTVQYVCTGWSGTGSVPASGTATNTGSFALTTDSTLVWLWETNYWLDATAATGGSVDVATGWQAAGGDVNVAATPGAYWIFSGWSGDTNGCAINDNTITVSMDGPRSIMANFAVDPLATGFIWQVDADGDWTDTANWFGGTVPGTSAGTTSPDEAVFPTTLTADRTVTLPSVYAIGTITFANTSGFGYTLSGSTFRINNGGVIQTLAGTGTHQDTIASTINLRGTGNSVITVRNNSTDAGLNITGNINSTVPAGKTFTLVLDGSNTKASIGGVNNSIGGDIGDDADGDVAVVKNGTGLWTLTGDNAFAGGLTVNAGTIRYFGANRRNFGAGTVTINDGVAFQKANNSSVLVDNPMVVNGNFEFKGNSDNNDWSGAMDLAAGTRTITANANLTVSGGISNGGLTKAGSAVLTLSGANSYAGGTFVAAGTLAGASTNAFGYGNATVADGAALVLQTNVVIHDEAALVLGTNAVLALDFAGFESVGSLSLDGGATWLENNTYDAVALGALGTGTYTGTGGLVVGGTASDPANTPYGWLAQYGLTNYDEDAMADVDNDGLLTWEEYVAGTDPTNQASVFAITGIASSVPGTVIRWASVANRFYGIDQSTNLLDVFTVLPGATNLPASPPVNAYTNPLPAGGAAFYRIRVWK